MCIYICIWPSWGSVSTSYSRASSTVCKRWSPQQGGWYQLWVPIPLQKRIQTSRKTARKVQVKNYLVLKASSRFDPQSELTLTWSRRQGDKFQVEERGPGIEERTSRKKSIFYFFRLFSYEREHSFLLHTCFRVGKRLWTTSLHILRYHRSYTGCITISWRTGPKHVTINL